MVNGQEMSIESFLIHPNYTGIGDNHNDICLLTLEDDLEFNDNVKAIALNNETVDAGTKCIVSGWGTLTVSSSVAFGCKFYCLSTYLFFFIIEWW